MAQKLSNDEINALLNAVSVSLKSASINKDASLNLTDSLFDEGELDVLDSPPSRPIRTKFCLMTEKQSLQAELDYLRSLDRYALCCELSFLNGKEINTLLSIYENSSVLGQAEVDVLMTYLSKLGVESNKDFDDPNIDKGL